MMQRIMGWMCFFSPRCRSAGDSRERRALREICDRSLVRSISKSEIESIAIVSGDRRSYLQGRAMAERENLLIRSGREIDLPQKEIDLERSAAIKLKTGAFER